VVLEDRGLTALLLGRPTGHKHIYEALEYEASL
jgi:hypothetical protein